MKVRELLRFLLWPLVAGALLVVSATFVAWAVEGQSAIADYFFNIIDLREERTFGTWFEGLLFVLTGLSFFLLSRHPRLPLFGKLFFIGSAGAFLFLSADEMMSLHEFLGYQFEQITGNVEGTRLDQRGYSWVMLYAPAALALLGFMQRFYRTLCDHPTRPAAHILFAAGWLAITTVLIMENAESWMVLSRLETPLMTCFEEFFELTALLLLYSSNLLIAESCEL